MYDFGAETDLITIEESWEHEITLLIDVEAAPEGAPSEISGEITGLFRDFDNRAGLFLLCEVDGKLDTIGIPIDVVTGYYISDLPEHWAEEDRAHLKGDRADFLEMVKDDVASIMKDDDPGLSDALFTDCESTIANWSDLKRLEMWQRACPENRGWYESPETFLIVGLAATLELDTAARTDRLIKTFEDLRSSYSDAETSAALAQVPADVEAMRLAASALNYAGILPMRGILFSLLASGGSFGPETAAALEAIEEGLQDRYARRNRSGMFH
jgi:hypothetical protein